MKRKLIRRQLLALILLALVVVLGLSTQDGGIQRPEPLSPSLQKEYFGNQSALDTLGSLDVKGRAPKTDYKRSQFGSGWSTEGSCDMRNIILKRDLENTKVDDNCHVVSGILNDPYTGKTINFQRGPDSSQQVQIDHVVALSDAWQKGAQQMSESDRVLFANDPLNLLAVDGRANQAKGDGDAATWLPPSKLFRCQYVARQVAVKKKYGLWVTEAEKRAMSQVLSKC